MHEDVCEYFDSFGLSMPGEVEEYLIKSGKTLFYSPDEIQERLRAALRNFRKSSVTRQNMGFLFISSK